MNEPTKAQIEELWRRCRLHYTAPYWVNSDNELAFYGEVYSELLRSINLNNLFKYAVPKLNCLPFIKLNLIEGTNYWHCSINQDYIGQDKDPALALFWALWRVKEKSNE